LSKLKPASPMKLLEVLTNTYKLSPEVADFLGKNLTVTHFDKGSRLFSRGQVCDCIYFLEKGTARGFHNEEGIDSTSWFVESGDFVYSVQSFLKQIPTQENVEFLEASMVVAIPLATLNHIYSAYPETNQIGRLITEKYLLLSDQRAYALRFQKDEGLLKGFIEDYPDIFAKAQRKHVASYLGMTPNTLSRLLSAKHK
jgi:CRP/FNR family transcriptional regulator, anaerobic regulatory protein